MTFEQTKEQFLLAYNSNAYLNMCESDDMHNAIIALEKQIPKKPINKTKCDNSTAKLFENCNIVVCPLCNGRLKLKSKGKHCDKCGQALDWGDSE